MKNCDMCGSEIINSKCSCGTWMDKEEMENCPIKKSLEKFHDLKQFVLTGDAPHLGCAVIFFRGDYNDCQKFKEIVYQIKNRPYFRE